MAFIACRACHSKSPSRHNLPAAARAEGQALSLDQAIALAVESIPI